MSGFVVFDVHSVLVWLHVKSCPPEWDEAFHDLGKADTWIEQVCLHLARVGNNCACRPAAGYQAVCSEVQIKHQGWACCCYV